VTPDKKKLLSQATEALQAGEPEQAISVLKDLLEKYPKNEIASGLLASIYAEIGMLDRAEEHFREALNANRQNPLLRLHLGLAEAQGAPPVEVAMREAEDRLARRRAPGKSRHRYWPCPGQKAPGWPPASDPRDA